MPVIWGFNLSEMRWSAFSSRNMFDRRWNLRKERFIVYQLAMLICLAAECTATYSLTKYEHLHNNDLIDAEISAIVFCVMVATVFGTDFFFLLFFPARVYPKAYNVIKLLLAVIISLGVLASAIVGTWVVATRQATITGVDAAMQKQLTDLYFRPPLVYRHWPTNIAYIVLLWIGAFCTIASTGYMFVAVDHDNTYGAEPLWEVDSNGEKVGATRKSRV